MIPPAIREVLDQEVGTSGLDGVAVAVPDPGDEIAGLVRSLGAEPVSSTKADVILDMRGQLSTALLGEQKLARVRGVVEIATDRSHQVLERFESGALGVPVVDAGGSRYLTAWSASVTAQTAIQAALKETNWRLPGKRVVVVGYGVVGQFLSRRLREMGGRVIVADPDPIRLLDAHLQGYAVTDLPLPPGDIVFGTEVPEKSLVVPGGALVVEAGAALLTVPADASRPRPGIAEVATPCGPVLVVDPPTPPLALVSVAVGLLAARMVVEGELAPGLWPFPADLDARLAAAHVRDRT